MTARLMAFVKDRPNQWIRATEFEQFGRQAWRTRLSEARKKFEAAHDGTIENRVQRVYREAEGDLEAWVFLRSEYRYIPEPVSVPAEGHDLNTWGLR